MSWGAIAPPFIDVQNVMQIVAGQAWGHATLRADRTYPEPRQGFLEMSDNVHQPKHYTSGAIECIDAIHAALGAEGFKAYCIGNAIKYQWRYRLKNGQEDLRKASVYLLWATTGNPSIKLDAKPETHHAVEAPMPPMVFVDDDEPPLRACPNGSCGVDD